LQHPVATIIPLAGQEPDAAERPGIGFSFASSLDKKTGYS
jgi:hypothetical protein